MTDIKIDKAALREMLLSGDLEEVVCFFRDMPETERRAYAPFCIEWSTNFFNHVTHDEVRRNEVLKQKVLASPLSTREYHRNLYRYLSALASIAVAATTNLNQFRRTVTNNLFLSFYGIDRYIAAVIERRHPSVIKGILEIACGNGGDLGWDIDDGHILCRDYWRLYRKFSADKVIQPAFSDRWTCIMFEAMITEASVKTDCSPKTISEQLDSNPDLLQEGIWRIFNVRDYLTDWSFAVADKNHLWKEAFVDLIAKDKIDKQRVLDGCFDAINSGRNDHHIRWFLELLEQISLEKTVFKNFQIRFLDLIFHPRKPPRALGFKYFEQYMRDGSIDNATILHYVPVLLREPSKAKVKKGLAILDKIAGYTPSLHHDVFHVSFEGLHHESPEIQQASIDLLLKYNAFDDPKFSEALNKLLPSLAASVARKIPGIPMVSPLSNESPVQSDEIRSKIELRKKDYITLFKNLIDSSPPVSIAATDRFIQAVPSGVFAVPQAVDAAVDVIGFTAFKVSRWIKPFLIVAEQSGRHAEAIQELLEGIIPHIEKKSLSGFLEVLVETSAILNRPVQSEPCREFLQSLSGSGKAAKLAKKLLEL